MIALDTRAALDALPFPALLEATEHGHKGYRLLARKRSDGRFDLHLLPVKGSPPVAAMALESIRSGQVRGCDEGKYSAGLLFASPAWLVVPR